MSRKKKIVSILLAAVMVLAMSVAVLADDSYTITINNATDGYVYTAYQIFAGTLSDDGTTLSDITWGTGIDSTNTELQAALTTAYGTTDAAEIAELLTSTSEAFAKIVAAYLQNGTASTDAGDTYTITVSAAGYYLIANTTVPSDGSYTSYILEIVDNVTVNAKSDTTTLDKEVESTTDSDQETSADYSVGDDVPFTLIATLPSNYSSYDTYKLIFHDTLSAGLNFNEDVVVTVYTACTGLTAWDTGLIYYTYDSATGEFTAVKQSATTIPDSTVTYYTMTIAASGYTVVTGTNMSDTTCSFEVQIAKTNELKDESGNTITVTNSSKIVVTYTAELLDSAASKETNKASVEYSNNPNDDGSGTGNTPEDIVTVFTFTLDVNKVDEDGNALEGAGFTLYKLKEQTALTAFAEGVTYYTYDDSTDTYTEVTDTSSGPASDTTYYAYEAVGSEVTAGYQAVTITEFAEGVTYYTYDSTTDTYTKVTDTTGTPDSGTTYYVKNDFTFDGLGVGYYKLVETTTPDGYNTMEDIYFTISATTEEDSGGTASVKSLTVTVTSPAGSTTSFTATASTQYITTDVVNNSGSELPSTGGIGTTIFYIVGGILVVGAAILLITRVRMRKVNE